MCRRSSRIGFYSCRLDVQCHYVIGLYTWEDYYYLLPFTHLGFYIHYRVQLAVLLVDHHQCRLMECMWRFHWFYSVWRRRHHIDRGKRRNFPQPRMRRVQTMTWSLILEPQGRLLCSLWFRSSGLLVEGHPNGLFCRWFSWSSASIIGLSAYGCYETCLSRASSYQSSQTAKVGTN